uniref:Uncharacterized protein n=1 Tax=Sphaerodactylus townsendi TaxID=933632 RepID=A0ACB8EQG2_9SAUR
MLAKEELRKRGLPALPSLDRLGGNIPSQGKGGSALQSRRADRKLVNLSMAVLCKHIPNVCLHRNPLELQLFLEGTNMHHDSLTDSLNSLYLLAVGTGGWKHRTKLIPCCLVCLLFNNVLPVLKT